MVVAWPLAEHLPQEVAQVAPQASWQSLLPAMGGLATLLPLEPPELLAPQDLLVALQSQTPDLSRLLRFLLE